MARICVDAGFLIGLYDPTDQHHQEALRQFELIFGEDSGRHTLLIPWPILYESLGTRFARNARNVASLERTWDYLDRADRLVLLDDAPYREECLAEQMDSPLRRLSLADRVIRAMILEDEPGFDFILTYNISDFIDACRNSRVLMIASELAPEDYDL
jgi:predicted nucleic acid-binding protein